MAKGKNSTVTTVFVNNKTATTVNKSVELVVVGNILMPDDRETNPGVIQGGDYGH